MTPHLGLLPIHLSLRSSATFVRIGSAAVAMLLVLIALLNFMATWPGERYGDLATLLASGRAQAAGLDPYSRPKPHLPANEGPGPNANPPVSLLFLVPLSRLDVATAYRLFHHVSLLLYIVCLGFLVRTGPHRTPVGGVCWALAMTAPWYTVFLGQIYILLLPLALAAVHLLGRNRSLLGGLFLGALIALKPNLAVWAMLLLVGGHHLTALVSCITAACISLVPLLAYGPGVYRQWLAASSSFSRFARVLPVDMSLPAVLARLGAAGLGFPSAAVVLLAALYAVWQLRPSQRHISELALAVSLLVSPRAWVGYAVFLLPIFVGRRWTAPLYAAALLLLAPSWKAWDWYAGQPALAFALGLAYALALLLVLAQVAMDLGPTGRRDSLREMAAP